jgi:hypothetical protein
MSAGVVNHQRSHTATSRKSQKKHSALTVIPCAAQPQQKPNKQRQSLRTSNTMKKSVLNPIARLRNSSLRLRNPIARLWNSELGLQQLVGPTCTTPSADSGARRSLFPSRHSYFPSRPTDFRSRSTDLMNSGLRLTQLGARTKKQTAPCLVTRSGCLGSSAGEFGTPAAYLETSPLSLRPQAVESQGWRAWVS